MPLPVVGKAHEAGGADRPFTWFVYGSSLDREAFAQWAGQHGYRVPDFSGAVPARLDGYRLSFDVRSNFWGGAVGSLAADPIGHVEGIAVPMPAAARGLVDHKEGAISGLFEPLEVQVTPLAGGPAIPALAFRASPGRRLAVEERPAPAFLETLIAGAAAAGLSRDWIATLEALRAR